MASSHVATGSFGSPFVVDARSVPVPLVRIVRRAITFDGADMLVGVGDVSDFGCLFMSASLESAAVVLVEWCASVPIMIGYGTDICHHQA